MRHLAALAVALAATACATVPPPAIPLDGLPEAFDMAGRMAVTSDGRGEIFRVRWSRSPQSEFWVVSSPVGTELARIERTVDGMRVLRPGSEAVEAASFADLTEAVLGAALDERLLVAWLHARPAAGPEGWTVAIDEARVVGDARVARRITATRDGVGVKLVVDDYSVPRE